MAFFENLVYKIFGNKDENSTFIHEIIVRSAAYNTRYEAWKMENNPTLNGIYTAFELKKKGIEQIPAVHLLISPYANGFAVTHNSSFVKDEFSFLLDFWKEKITELPYRCVNYDRTIREKGTFIETIEKAYLKPMNNHENPINQRFGNILIEAVAVDHQPSYLKLNAAVYSDRLYSAPLPFDTLIQQIIN